MNIIKTGARTPTPKPVVAPKVAPSKRAEKSATLPAEEPPWETEPPALGELKIYKKLEQGSPEWFEARRGILTASRMASMITAKTLKPANNATSRGVIEELAAERITGHVEDTYVSHDMERGIWDEPFARDAYANHFAPVQEVGFMVRTIGPEKLGYSPDGLVGDDGLIEIKSRKPRYQLQTIIENKMPSTYMAQIQTGLYVSGREWCDFISYSGGMPLFVKRIHTDPAWQEAIGATVRSFAVTMLEIQSQYAAATQNAIPTERTNFGADLPDLEF